jgi:broad specificity phosphatase PhoE/2'-5' RNA ligase
LTPSGQADAKKLAQNTVNVTSIDSTPMSRGMETAHVLANQTTTHVEPQANPALGPWDLGQFAGQRQGDVKDQIDDYIANKPDEPVPGGESFNAFRSRFIGGMQQQIGRWQPGDRQLHVTHSIGVHVTQAWMANGAPEDGSIDTQAMLNRQHMTPAALFRIDPTVQPLQMTSANNTGKEGVYLARHADTAWDNVPKGAAASASPGLTSPPSGVTAAPVAAAPVAGKPVAAQQTQAAPGAPLQPGPRISQILSPGAWADSFERGERVSFTWNGKRVTARVDGREGDDLKVSSDSGLGHLLKGTTARQEDVQREPSTQHGKLPEAKPSTAPTKEPAGGTAVTPAASTYDYSSTQVNLPPSVSKNVINFGKTIPQRILAPDGREAEPHVTVKYGLHGEDPDQVRRLLANEGPITATLGKASLFHTDDADVLKVDVESPDLHRLNGIVAQLPHTDTHPTYQPHVTIAYLKKGEGKQYDGKSIPGVTGQEVSFDAVTFSSAKDGKQTEVPLAGKPAIPSAPETAPNGLPTFAEGDRVSFTRKGKQLTGTVRSVDPNRYDEATKKWVPDETGGTVDIDTDQIAHAGGVPIKRLEAGVPVSRVQRLPENGNKPSPLIAVSPQTNRLQLQWTPQADATLKSQFKSADAYYESIRFQQKASKAFIDGEPERLKDAAGKKGADQRRQQIKDGTKAAQENYTARYKAIANNLGSVARERLRAEVEDHVPQLIPAPEEFKTFWAGLRTGDKVKVPGGSLAIEAQNALLMQPVIPSGPRGQ